MNLLLLTKFYPYGTEEAFLENEIESIAAYYKQVVIVACEVDKKKSHKIRPLPSNVKALFVPKTSKIKDILSGCKYFFSREKVFLEEKKILPNLTSKIFLTYFEAKSYRIFKHIVKKTEINLLCNKSYVLYSYWLFVTARVGTLIIKKFPPRYLFCRAHRYDLYENENRLNYIPYRKLFLCTYNNIYPCSNHGTNYLKTLYPQATSHVKTSYLGTNDYGIGSKSSDGVFRLVSCSRVESVKRVDKIIKALSILEKENLQIEWMHIGGGSELKKIKKISSKSLHKIKCVFTGNMKNCNIMDIYKTYPVDLFVNVSCSEGLPVSIMEAISFGIPVIATDVGGTSEIIKDGITGKLILKNFTDMQLAQEIKKMMQLKTMQELRESCRNFWEKNFQAKVQYTKFYESIERKLKKLDRV